MPCQYQGSHLHHSTIPPAAPLPSVPVQYVTVKKQTDYTETKLPEKEEKVMVSLEQGFYYSDLHHCTNPPAPAKPSVPVQHNTVREQSCELETLTVSALVIKLIS